MTRNTNPTMRFLLALLLSVGFSASAAAGPWTGAARDTTDRAVRGAAPQAQARTASLVRAPEPGSCEIGRSNGTLNVNQVQATVFTTGTLFYGPGGQHEYYVPQQSRLSPVYASSVWIAGLVGGELRVAGATYGQGGTNNDYFEFWPGPLNDDASLVNEDCSVYDKIYVVSREDIQNYDAGGPAGPDLQNWPANLGAPVIDGDGDPDNYNLAGGDRPDIIGDQSLWYVLNDVGNLHRTTGSEPIGMEVRIQAFSFARDNALGQTTFYKYTLVYKGDAPLTEAYLSVFSDPDLGNAVDDFVGVDPGISMGYVYNADEVDDGNYGTAPPAAGYDFFQGPLVDSNEDGVIDENDERLGLTSFMYFINGDANRGDPRNAAEYYRIMQGQWADGTPLTAFGTGYNQGGAVTQFAYPGDPVSRDFWSEEATGSGRNVPGDRRFVLSTGPFTINPGDSQEIVFGIVYGRGNNRLSSITALRAADVFAQSAYDLDFDLPVPAPAPPRCDNPNGAGANARLPGSGTCFTASEEDGQVILTWGYAPSDPAFLGNYESQGYEFEGFNLYRYPNGSFRRDDRELVATYDKINDITTLQNIFFDPEVGADVPVLAAQGTDSGLAYSYQANNLTNYTDYYYGLTTYIVDDLAPQERVIESAPTFLTVRPSNSVAAQGGTALGSQPGQALTPDFSGAFGSIVAGARIIDPSLVTGARYEIVYRYVDTDDDGDAATPSANDDADPETPDEPTLAYQIRNATTGDLVFDGIPVVQNGQNLPFGPNVFTVNGITFDIEAPAAGFESFDVVQNASGPLNPAEPGAAAFGGWPTPDGANPSGRQQANSNNAWFIGCARNIFGLGFCNNYDEFVENIATDAAVPNDWEIRFPADPKVPLGGFAYGSTGALANVPFELWDIGIATPDDPSDDVRYFPVMLDLSAAFGRGIFEMANDAAIAAPYGIDGADPSFADSGISSLLNDPVSDLFSWAAPREGQPGQTGEAGYEDWVNLWKTDQSAAVAAARRIAFGPPTPFVLMSLVGWNLGSVTTAGQAPYRMTFPEPGTVFRISTFKPIREGDVVSIDTAPFSIARNQGYTQEEADRIGVVPNPYYGFSEYESGNTERVARFTNLPERATIRIFTVSGTLIRTLTKDSNQRSFDWNLQTENGLPVASGLYLIHVELPDSGLERVIKFGVVNRQTQIEIL